MWIVRSLGQYIHQSNVNGTFHLLQAVHSHWEELSNQRRAAFRFHHISTDEVFGLGRKGA